MNNARFSALASHGLQRFMIEATTTDARPEFFAYDRELSIEIFVSRVSRSTRSFRVEGRLA